MIHVIATIEIQAGRRDEFLKIFRALVPTVRAEPGCLEYGPATDVPSGIPVQAPLRADGVVILEQWQDLAALKLHLGTKHMLQYREQVKTLVKGVHLQVLQPA